MLASQGRYKPGEPRPPAYEIHEGVHIHRVPATSLGRRGTWARMTDYLSFYAGAMVKALLLPRFDVVVTLTTPPIIGLVGTLLKRLQEDAARLLEHGPPSRRQPGARPDVAQEPVRPLDVLAERLRLSPRRSGRRARPVHGRPDRLEGRRSRADHDDSGLEPARRDLPDAARMPIRCASRSGSRTRSSRCTRETSAWPTRSTSSSRRPGGSATAPTSSSSCRRRPAARRSQGGPRSRRADEHPVSRLRSRASQLHASLALADVHLISMRPEMTGIVVPGKLYGVMAAGRPAVFVGPEHCESADTIRDAGCGITVTPGDADGLVAALLRLASDPSLARRMGEKGRSAFLIAHDRKLCCAHWYELIGEPGRSTRKAGGQVGRRRHNGAARHAQARGRAVCHALSVSRSARDRPATTTTTILAN